MDKLPPITVEHLREGALIETPEGCNPEETYKHLAWRAADRIEQLEQYLLDQRYKHQRVCKAASDLVDLVEWHAYRGEESQRRLSVVKQTLAEFGPDIEGGN